MFLTRRQCLRTAAGALSFGAVAPSLAAEPTTTGGLTRLLFGLSILGIGWLVSGLFGWRKYRG